MSGPIRSRGTRVWCTEADTSRRTASAAVVVLRAAPIHADQPTASHRTPMPSKDQIIGKASNVLLQWVVDVVPFLLVACFSNVSPSTAVA